ncbi:hypothetical protein KM043_000823 [Ampulex compressa]|nr:hypothetical protein KM043_000823 [Ampulex compressa]
MSGRIDGARHSRVRDENYLGQPPSSPPLSFCLLPLAPCPNPDDDTNVFAQIASRSLLSQILRSPHICFSANNTKSGLISWIAEHRLFSVKRRLEAKGRSGDTEESRARHSGFRGQETDFLVATPMTRSPVADPHPTPAG